MTPEALHAQEVRTLIWCFLAFAQGRDAWLCRRPIGTGAMHLHFEETRCLVRDFIAQTLPRDHP
jgi:hypothetical protein